MSLIILSEAGYIYGFGHFYRMSGICEKALAEGRDSVMYLVGDDVAKKNLKRPFVSFEDWHDKARREELITKDDTIVIDSYHVEVPELEELQKIAGKMIVVDDNIRLDYHDMAILNPNYFAVYLDYPQDRGNTYYLGKDYTLLRGAFDDIPERTTREKVSDVLITMGGTDLKHMTVKAIRTIKSVSDDIRIHVVATDAYTDIDEIRSLLTDNDRLYSNVDAEGMRALMLDCDFTVASAGGTSNELIRTKCPSALVVVADNQLLNIKYLSEAGAFEVIQDEPEKVIKSMMSHEKRSRMAEVLETFSSDHSGKDLIMDIAFGE